MASTQHATGRLFESLLVILLAGCCIPPAQAAHVLVDTGHTPQQPGATGASGRVEYLYNPDLSAAVAHALTALGDRTTRLEATGSRLTLAQRTTVASDVDLFVSIHHDSIQRQYIDAGRQHEFAGYSIFVSKRNPQYMESLRCARAIGAQLLTAGERPSRYHAEPIQGENRPLIDSRLGIHQFDDLVVLRSATMPAVLIEAGVIVNPTEEARLARPDTIRHLAQAIARGAHDCLTP